MSLFVDNLFAPDQCAAWVARMKDAPFKDGGATAGWLAKSAKNNEQLADSCLINEITNSVQTALWGHPVITTQLRPAKLAPLRISRYKTGMSYGKHVDDARIGGARTDISFTIFLNDEYEGGALRLHELSEIEDIRLQAGQAVFYSAGALHEVTEVTGGERIVIVGWIESQIADMRKREILADIETVRNSLFANRHAENEVLQLSKALTNLQRLWK